MEPEVFAVVTKLEMQDERERKQNLPREQRMRAMHPDAARFLHIVAVGSRARSVVEVGTGHGYSTIWLALAAQKSGGRVVTYEIDPAIAEQARNNIAAAGLSDLVEIVVGDARTLLRERDEPVDLLFIDGEKDQYETYFDVVYKRMDTGSMILADNVVSHEYELADYITYVQNHPNLESVTVPVGRGVEVSVKTG